MTGQVDPLTAAESLSTLVREAAEESEQARRLNPAAVDALRSAGLFHLSVPRSYGGLEASPVDTCRVIEAISAADGSAGWCLMIAAQQAAFSGFMEPATSEAVWENGGIVAGVARPIGKARRVAGGLQVEGRWPFASGSSHATTFAGECLLYDGDQPVRDDSGNTPSYMAFVPREAVTVHDTWDTTGLRGTASHDFSVAGAIVQESHFMPMIPPPTHPWALFRSLALIFTTHGAQALGVARASLETTIDMARTKIGWGTDRPMSENVRLQGIVAEAAVTYASARDHLYAATTNLWTTLERGEEPGALNGRVRLATSHAAAASVRTVDLLHDAMATSSIFRKSPLERQFRDIHTAAAHVMVGPLTYEAAGRVELGLPAGMPFFE
ncbi:MAG: acyl-CoA dehydrogenase family protein [Dehalococcoidia bacterium]